jgi:hypothetical protein
MSLLNENCRNDHSIKKICTLCQNVKYNNVLIKLDDCGCRNCLNCLSEYLKDKSRLFNWKCKLCNKEVSKVSREENLIQENQRSRLNQELVDF